MYRILMSLFFSGLFSAGVFAGEIKPVGELTAGAAALNVAFENYIRFSTNTETDIFRLISENAPKYAARKEVLLAGFVKYLTEEQAILEMIQKDAVGIAGLSESETSNPAAALAEINRVQKYLQLRLLNKRRKIEAFDEALKMSASKYSYLVKLSRLFYSGNPTPDIAADAYAGVQASRDFLSNYLRALARSAPLADLEAAGRTARIPPARPEMKSYGAQEPDSKWASSETETERVGDLNVGTGGD